ncbi:MAG: hypothetical protein ACPGWS_00715 [Solirubrobacterales bacterium]
MTRIKISLPATAFAGAVCWIGWTAGHELTYDVLGLAGSMPAASVHGYLPFARGGAAIVAVIAFGLIVRALFATGTPAAWLGRGGLLGTRSQVLIATLVPSITFFVAENVERAYASETYVSFTELFAAGLPVQMLVGLATLLIARIALRTTARIVTSLRMRAELRRIRCVLRLRLPLVTGLRCRRPLIELAAGRAPPCLMAV